MHFFNVLDLYLCSPCIDSTLFVKPCKEWTPGATVPAGGCRAGGDAVVLYLATLHPQRY